MLTDPDEPGGVGNRLDRLRDEVDGVTWPSTESVRRRGRQRIRRRAAAGSVAVCLGFGTLALSVTGNLPGQGAFLQDTLPLAGVPSNERTAGSPDGSNAGKGQKDITSPHEYPSPDPTDTRPPSNDAGKTTGPSGPNTSPTDGPSNAGSNSPSPGASGAPTTALLVDTGVLIQPGGMPHINDQGSWSGTGADKGESHALDVARCVGNGLSGFEDTAVASRGFTWSDSLKGATAAASFETPDTAGTVYSTLLDRAGSCDLGTADGPTDVSVTDGSARYWTYEQAGTDSAPGQVHAIGVVQRGSAVAYVTWHNDDSTAFTYDKGSMAASLQAAASNLADFSD